MLPVCRDLTGINGFEGDAIERLKVLRTGRHAPLTKTAALGHGCRGRADREVQIVFAVSSIADWEKIDRPLRRLSLRPRGVASICRAPALAVRESPASQCLRHGASHRRRVRSAVECGDKGRAAWEPVSNIASPGACNSLPRLGFVLRVGEADLAGRGQLHSRRARQVPVAPGLPLRAIAQKLGR